MVWSGILWSGDQPLQLKEMEEISIKMMTTRLERKAIARDMAPAIRIPAPPALGRPIAPQLVAVIPDHQETNPPLPSTTLPLSPLAPLVLGPRPVVALLPDHLGEKLTEIITIPTPSGGTKMKSATPLKQVTISSFPCLMVELVWSAV
jgi:hypothetical protein